MSELPQELFDHIIDHIPDRRSLKACSLVCSRWSARSQKRLFVQVEFKSEFDLRSWCTRVCPVPEGPSSLVEDLFMPAYDSSPATPRLPLPPCTGFHLQSFSGLRTPCVWKWKMSVDHVSSALHSLGTSCENVTHLTLDSVDVDPSALSMFLSHFPRLKDLTIYFPSAIDGSNGLHRGFQANVVPTRPRGEFYESGHMRFPPPKGVYDTIVLLEPRFHKISLEHRSYPLWRDHWPLLEACGGSLEELHILGTAASERTPQFPIARCSRESGRLTIVDFLSRVALTFAPSAFHLVPTNTRDVSNSSRNAFPPSLVPDSPK